MDKRFRESLIADLSPVRPASLVREWMWISLSLALTGVVFVSIASVRLDLASVAAQARDWFFWVGFASIGLSSSYLAVRSSLPGSGKDPRSARAAIAVGFLLILLAGISGIRLETPFDPDWLEGGWRCGRVVFVWSILTGFGVLFKLRSLASLNGARTGGWVALSAAAFAGLAIAFHCGNDDSTHVLVWHGLIPMAAVFCILRVASSRILRL